MDLFTTQEISLDNENKLNKCFVFLKDQYV